MSNITLENWENARGEKSRYWRGPKPVARGQLLKSTAWLEGALVWHDGALVWKIGAQIVVADGARIEAAERALDKLESRAGANQIVEARRQKWRLARKLGALQARDLDKLCAVSRRRNPAALKRLAPLLVLESLAVELPHSPARALFEAWPYSRNALESVVGDENWPMAARELAAFIVGAAGPSEIAQLPKSRRGVAALGTRFRDELTGFECPALLLCAARQNDETAFRFVELSQSRAPFAPDARALQRLATAHGLERALEIGAQLASGGEVWPELPVVACDEDERQMEMARGARLLWRRARRQWEGECRQLLPQMALQCPAAIAPFWALCRELLGAADRVLAHPSRGRKNRRKLPRLSVDAALFSATLGALAARKSVALAQRALLLRDPVDFLELWREVARHNLKHYSAPRYDARDARVSRRWFGLVLREIEEDVQPLLRLAQVGDGALARAVWKRGHHRMLGRAGALAVWPQAQEGVQCWVQLVLELPMRAVSLRKWSRLWSKFDENMARQVLPALVRATRGAPTKTRAAMMCGLLQGMPSRAGAREIWPHLPALVREFAPLLSALDAACVASASASLRHMAAIGHHFEIAPAQWPILVRAMLHARAEAALQDENSLDCEQLCEIAARLCCACQTEDVQMLESALRAALGQALKLLPVKEDFLENALPGARLVSEQPQLARALRCGLEVAPQRALNALEHLAALERAHHLEPLQMLEVPAPEPGQSWQEIARISPAIEQLARDYARWQALAGEAVDVPSSVQKVVDWPRKWTREIEALQSRVAQSPQLQSRLDNLRARLADEPKWRAQQADEIAQLLKNATKRAAFAALERVIESAFRARLEKLCGALPADFAFDDDWFNALLLGSDVEYNRKWARQLLRHEVAGARDWRQQLPGNARFLAQLGERGADTKFYLSEFGRARGELWLWIENAPLGILQMGNRFNTCLSRGGCNSFAGVANAIDLNKRVVYARDRKGHIVARQLWAINQEFQLVGFHVYSTYMMKEREGLEAIFAAHAREFARSCGLELADKGEVENLVAPQWYDDGACEWETVAENRARTSGNATFANTRSPLEPRA